MNFICFALQIVLSIIAISSPNLEKIKPFQKFLGIIFIIICTLTFFTKNLKEPSIAILILGLQYMLGYLFTYPIFKKNILSEHKKSTSFGDKLFIMLNNARKPIGVISIAYPILLIAFMIIVGLLFGKYPLILIF